MCAILSSLSIKIAVCDIVGIDAWISDTRKDKNKNKTLNP